MAWAGKGGIARESTGRGLGPDELFVPNEAAKMLHYGDQFTEFLRRREKWPHGQRCILHRSFCHCGGWTEAGWEWSQGNWLEEITLLQEAEEGWKTAS